MVVFAVVGLVLVIQEILFPLFGGKKSCRCSHAVRWLREGLPRGSGVAAELTERVLCALLAPCIHAACLPLAEAPSMGAPAAKSRDDQSPACVRSGGWWCRFQAVPRWSWTPSRP